MVFVDNKGGYMLVYSAQSQIVLDTIAKEDIYYVKRRYITEKYGEVAAVMLQAYDWFVIEMMKRVHKPDGAEYPVWNDIDKKYLYIGNDAKLLTLQVPNNELILFDNHGWERVLQMNYVGMNLEDERIFDNMLESRGISTGSEVFLSPYYPAEKQKIIKSWSRIFNVTLENATRCATWKIENTWIKKINR